MNAIQRRVAEDSPAVALLEQQLGQLAMWFRGTQSETERENIKRAYAQAVSSLIASGGWSEVPAPEDQLPDDWMPQAFFDYWASEEGALQPART